MRLTILGVCIFAAACGSQPSTPSAPSGVVDTSEAQSQARGGASNVDVAFTKWPDPAFPFFAGESGDDGPGSFKAEVLERTIFENGNIVKLRARYAVIADDPDRAFVALIEGTQNNQTQAAVLNGTIVEGWMVGARVHVTFDVIRPCPEFGRNVCFTGVIRVMSGSAQ